MISFRIISYILGLLTIVIGCFLLVPIFISWIHNEIDLISNIYSFFAIIFIGCFLSIPHMGINEKLNNKDVYLLITLIWIFVPVIGSIPFFMNNDINVSIIDGFFESFSGVTTTGATIFTNLDTMPKGILMWRSILQWLGGVGIIVMVSGVVGAMSNGGMQLMKLEFDPSIEKQLPKASQMARFIFMVYFLLTFILFFLYFVNGMSGFDAINHAMTTMATGGYSTHDESLGYFKNSNILIISNIFMVISSLPFLIVFGLLLNKPTAIFKDAQVKLFLLILIVAIIIGVILNADYYPSLKNNIIQTSFNITSMMTGTGYASADFNLWGVEFVPLILLLMFFGGCNGSTTCGLKMFRLSIFISSFTNSIKQLINPHGYFNTNINHRNVDDKKTIEILTYIYLFVIIFFILTFLFTLTGSDFLTSISAAISSLSCVGPGLGEQIGPSSTYQNMPDSFKSIFILGMLIGRLEILTLILICSKTFWSK